MTATAVPANLAPDLLDLRQLPFPVIVQRLKDDREHVLIGSHRWQLRLDVQGTVLNGPVSLRYRLEGHRRLEPKLKTLERLAAILRLKRLPSRLAPLDRPSARAVMAIRALDAKQSGASLRDIAGILVGPARVQSDWAGASDYLRSRVQRLVRLGSALSRNARFSRLE